MNYSKTNLKKKVLMAMKNKNDRTFREQTFYPSKNKYSTSLTDL